MGHKQLDFRKRCQIYGLWRAGHTQAEIAKEVGVHKLPIPLNSIVGSSFNRSVITI